LILAFIRRTVKIAVSRFKWAKLTAVNFSCQGKGLRSQAYAIIPYFFFFFFFLPLMI